MSLVLGSATSACMLGPDYMKPTIPLATTYKEVKGWRIARPSDAVDRGDWWKIYHDKTLNSLEPQVEISNQTLAAAEAAYRQAAAVVQEARAALFPTIDLVYNPVRSYTGPKAFGSGSGVAGAGTGTGTGSGSGSGNSSGAVGNHGIATTRVTLETTGTWDLDIWGRIRRMIESDIDLAQASAADVANARLSAQEQLAVAYFNLRAADSLAALLRRTLAEYKRTQTITENQYAQGTVARSDVITAQTQVKTVEANLINVGVQRAQFEHAIAMLIGKVPAELSIKPGELGTKPPVPRPGTPASLLERRPDIAAAERRVAAQNALIGVAVTAYFPDVTLSGLFGWVGTTAFPINVANEVWQIGATATETIIDGGLRRAQLAAAEATFYQAVATLRQTILVAFQQVEDQLSNLRIYARQQTVQDEAVALSRQAVEIFLNEYRAGTVAFTSVVTAQATLLANEQAALTIRQNRYIASVTLVQALGGGWDTGELPGSDHLAERRSCVDVRGAIRGHVEPEMPGCL